MILAAAIAFACGVDGPGREPDATGPSLSQPPAKARVASLSAAVAVALEPSEPDPTAMTPEGSEPTRAMPSLEDLLRLPASVAQADDVAQRSKPSKPDEGESADEEGDALRLELETRSDRAALRPSTSRDRTDAGVSVGVSETIRLRGGVRLEEESGKEPEDLVPTVGIEKRF